jgi:hypothetical protein
MDRLVARLDTPGHSRSPSSVVSTHDPLPQVSTGARQRQLLTRKWKRPQPDPLPAWLFDTFSRLEPGHPLRSLITPPRQASPRHLASADPMFAYSIDNATRSPSQRSSPLFISDLASQTDPIRALDIDAQALPFSTPGPGARAHSRPSNVLGTLQEPDDYDDDEPTDSDPPAYSLSYIPFSTPGPAYPPQDPGSGSSSDVHYAGIDFRWEPFDRKGIELQSPADNKDLIGMAVSLECLSILTSF